MSDTAFLEDTSTETGLVAAGRLSDLLHVTRGELARARRAARVGHEERTGLLAGHPVAAA